MLRWTAALGVSLGGCGGIAVIDLPEEDSSPASEAEPRRVVGISAGGAHTCVLRADQTITCFGGGVGVPREMPFSPSVEVVVGAAQVCARTHSGSVECIELSYQEVQPIADPSVVPGIDDATQVTVGPGHACAVRENGQLSCWGDNTLGQLGNGTFESSVAPSPVDIGPVQWATAGEFNVCALTEAGAFCWGRGALGALGDGLTYPDEQTFPPEATCQPSPAHVAELTGPVELSAGLNAACAVDGPDRSIACWGQSNHPPGLLDLEGVEQVFVGYTSGCVVLADGHASCWSGGGDVVALEEVDAVAGGWSHTCALDVSGDVHCWGAGELWQPEPGDVEAWATPRRVDL